MGRGEGEGRERVRKAMSLHHSLQITLHMGTADRLVHCRKLGHSWRYRFLTEIFLERQE